MLSSAFSASSALTQDLPQKTDPAALAAKESHEGLLVAADPYTDAARAKARFGKKNPHNAGVLALEVFIINDNTRAIQMDLSTIRLILESGGRVRQRLEPMAIEEVIVLVLDPKRRGPKVDPEKTPRPRIPGIGGGDKSKDAKEVDGILRPALLEMDIIPPKATVRGFLFFDMDHRFEKLGEAKLLIPKLKFVDNGQELFFFEVDLSKATADP